MMKKAISLVLTLCLVIACTVSANAASYDDYYAAGQYVSYAPTKPSNLRFYIDSSAANTFSTTCFQAAYDWNGISNNVRVTSIASYPAPSSQFYNYFFIEGENLGTGTNGATYWYNSSGASVTYNDSSIYSASIEINTNLSSFNINGKFSSDYVKRTIRHEVGHVLLLAHPSNLYFASIMHSGVPGGVRSMTITSTDEENIRYKWG